jgi:hypothetical protein
MCDSADGFIDRVVGALRVHDFERLLDVPALPVHNEVGARYSMTARTDQAELWHVRSTGLDFSIVARPWVRAGMTRCYTLGWGATGSGDTDRLLLAQAFEAGTPAAHRLAGSLREALEPAVRQGEWHVNAERGTACLRMWAVVKLDPMRAARA